MRAWRSNAWRRSNGQGPPRGVQRWLVAKTVGNDIKGKISPVLYLIAIPAAYVSSWISGALYVFVALMWLLPDRRIERVLTEERPVH